MLIRPRPEIPSSEITPERLFLDRRGFLAAGAKSLAIGAAASVLAACDVQVGGAAEPAAQDDKLTPLKDVTSYNNFYEFGTDKGDPAKNAGTLRPRPWTIRIEGMAKKTGDMPIDSFVAPYKLEDHTYRARCVEGWSMVIPWQGIPLKDVLATIQPTSSAKFVEFTTLMDPSQMPGERSSVLKWPYVEGLRLDEAMNPLTLLVTGVYGKTLPNQNGAPIRLITPWKYGFKGIKSIVKIRLTDTMPVNTWQIAASNEYGFYANVNPKVDHPRWSQATERRIGDFFKRPTLMFNGYSDQVASMYAGMDLKKWF